MGNQADRSFLTPLTPSRLLGALGESSVVEKQG
jgi:hypothetical protein